LDIDVSVLDPAIQRMHEATHFLTDLTLVLVTAALTTVVFQKLHQPVVLGYLLAGMIVGPHVPIPIVADEHTVHTLSELGVILLMFSLGLEFSLRKLFQVGMTSGLVATIQCSLMLWLGYLTGKLFGWSTLESLYAGAIIAISSTTIIVKAFEEQGVRGKLAEMVFGVLIVEDLIAILLLAVLTTISSGAGLSASSLAWTVARLSAFLLALIVVGFLVVPRMFRGLAKLNNPETTLVASVGFCFMFAWLAQAAGYSVALGAFLAGALVAESGVEKKVEHLVQPVRDMFAAIFFVAVGMLIDPALIAQHWVAVCVFTLVVIFGKLAGVTLGAFLAGAGIRTSIQAGMSLAQIGEFSFIIAGVGAALGSTQDFLYPIAVAVSAITTLVTPWLTRSSGPVSAFVDRRLPKPLQTFAALYGSWLEQLRTSPQEKSVAQRMRRLVVLLAIDAAALACAIIGASIGMEWFPQWVQSHSSYSGIVGRLAILVVCLLVSLPFCVGIARCAQSLGSLLGMAVLPAAEKGSLDLAAAPRKALVITLQVTIVLLVGIPLVAVTQPWLPAFGGAALLAGVLATLAFAFWRTATNLQGHVQAGAQMIADVLARQADAVTPDEDFDTLHTLDQILPGMGTPTAVRLQPASPALGRTLVQLNLRGQTGATVLAIARGDRGLLPSGKEPLLAGDILVLAGTHESVAAARELLKQPAGETPGS
jgi:CPA2 family monovalent cation:H+ antiporter-2